MDYKKVSYSSNFLDFLNNKIFHFSSIAYVNFMPFKQKIYIFKIFGEFYVD